MIKSIMFNGKEYSEGSLKAHLRDRAKKTLMKDRDYRFIMSRSMIKDKNKSGKMMLVNAMVDRIVQNSYNTLMEHAI